MENFETLFGTDADSLCETCVIVPFITKEIIAEFHIDSIKKGLLFSTGQAPFFTLIQTSMGTCFTGDAVLHLKKTKCSNLFFFGSCGAVKKEFFRPDTLLLVKKSYPLESFSNMLASKVIRKPFYPEKKLFQACLERKDTYQLKEVTALTVGSLKLEKKYLKEAQNRFSADVLDMETSAFFSAACYTNKKSAAFLFATDHIEEFPYEKAFGKSNRSQLNNLTSRSARKFYQIIKDLCM